MSDRTLSDSHPDQVAQPSADQVSAPEHENPNETRSTRILQDAIRSAPDRRALLTGFAEYTRQGEVLSWLSCHSRQLAIGIPRSEFGLFFQVLCDYVDELEERAFAGGRPAAADPVDDEQLLEHGRLELDIEELPACAACGVTEVRVVSGHVSCASCGTAKEAPRG